MRSLDRALVLTGALLAMAAAGSASSAGRHIEYGPHPTAQRQKADAVPSTGEVLPGTPTLYAKPRCSTIKPFPCGPKRTESPA